MNDYLGENLDRSATGLFLPTMALGQHATAQGMQNPSK